MIDKFSGDNAFLSNFHPSPIMYEGIEFPTVERSGDSSGSVSSQFHSYVSESDRPDGCGPYGTGVSQDDR